MQVPLDNSPDSLMHPTPPPETSQGPDDRRSNERFELLSAYMDGEVTAEERRLVESWLANEPKVQQMHQRLLALKDGFSALPTAARSRPIETTIDQVFEKVERRSRLRVMVGGAMAAAAAIVATVVGINSVGNGSLQFASQTANRTQPRISPSPVEEKMTAGYLVSLEEPVIPLSKSALGGKKGPWSQNDAQ